MAVTEDKARKYNCYVDVAVNIICGKYKAVILMNLMYYPVMRYSEMQRAIPKASPKMLSQQLQDLETDGLISRKVYPTVPLKTEYSLTDLGKSVAPILDSLFEWGKGYAEMMNWEI